MSKNYTPGPWKWRKTRFQSLSGSQVDCLVGRNRKSIDPEKEIVFHVASTAVNEADKKLIAASPDLVEALEAMVKTYCTGVNQSMDDWGLKMRAESALRKAGVVE